MEKKTLIWLAVGGGLLYLYYISQKKKANDTATLEKAESLKAKIKSSIQSSGLLKINADNKEDTSQSMIDRLSKTIDANLLSVDELQKIADVLDARVGNYVGTKSKEQIGNEANEVFIKYQIQKR